VGETTTTKGDKVAKPDGTTTTEAVTAPSTSPALRVVGNVVIPDGEVGKLSVVLLGLVDDGGSVPVVVRNRTDDTLYSIEASATARDAAGALAGSGSSQGFSPSTVEPGEWAFGYVYFSGDVPADATFDVTATGESDDGFIGSLDVTPVETNVVPVEYGGNEIVGIVENPNDETVSGPVSVDIICFDAAGTAITGTHQSFTDAEEVAAGGTASFSVSISEDPCPNYAVGASGYSFGAGGALRERRGDAPRLGSHGASVTTR
jgi:hypothetical protein